MNHYINAPKSIKKQVEYYKNLGYEKVDEWKKIRTKDGIYRDIENTWYKDLVPDLILKEKFGQADCFKKTKIDWESPKSQINSEEELQKFRTYYTEFIDKDLKRYVSEDTEKKILRNIIGGLNILNPNLFPYLKELKKLLK